MLKIAPLQRNEIPLLLAIRNDERTRSRLDSNQVFTVEEGYHWFDSTKPEWHAIYLADTFVGYIRTTPQDGSIGIGCDIHPEYRNQGFGRYALNWIVVQSLSKGIDNIWLQCFIHNENAFHLYQELGFVVIENLETRGLPAVKMELQIEKQSVDLLTILNVSHANDYLNFLKTTLSGEYLQLDYKTLNHDSTIDLTCGSDSHAQGIMYLAKQVTSKNFIICDYDTAIICSAWDKILCYLLKQYVALGTEYPACYKKYVEFPTLFFSLWNTAIWQKTQPNLDRYAEYDASLTNYRFLDKPDIGNALPSYFKNYRSLPWRCGTHHNLETYFVYDVPFVTHLGRGSGRVFNSHPRAIDWVNKVTSLLAR